MKKFVLTIVVMVFAISDAYTREQDVITFQVGEATLSTLTDVHSRNTPANLIGATPEILRKYAPEGVYPAAINAFLARINGKTILIDTGLGQKLKDNLRSLGTDPEQIDAVLITHAHGDHIGGLLDSSGKPAFPNADLYFSKAEHDYWKAVSGKSNALFLKIVEAYGDRLKLFVPSEPEPSNLPLAGIRALSTPGHTPGHTAFLLESDGSKLLVWGDLTHATAIQLPHPEVAITYDVDPAQAVATRAKVLEYVAENKIPVAGMHIAFPSVGDVRKNDGQGYLFSPFCTCLGI
ncbi:MAG: MBL fold metallo-hydrolase [Prevotellaceae bacterium]|jgi:glyoxylase-like metal-dependent hydrolase (beta-lactamase superfamily II)|nr:MBL fold metallo-hydrolase [Prevotellaceae bacterium]